MMLNYNYTEDAEDCCQGLWPAFEIAGLVPVLAVQHLVTATMLTICGQVVYNKVDFSHPVFAIILQELLVLSTCEVLEVILVVASWISRKEIVVVAYFVIGRTAAIFHPSTWLVVTYLRFHILVKNQGSNNIDLLSLRRKCLYLVWVLFLAVFFLNQTVIRLYFSWTYDDITTLSMRSLTRKLVIITNILGTTASNIPDLISVIIYFKLWRHFNSKVQDQAAPVPVHIEEDYGGIWVGEEQQDVPQVPPQPQLSDDATNEPGSKDVMRALGWHLKLALVDVLAVVLVGFGCSKVPAALAYIFQSFCFFMVPFLVIKYGFKQLDGIMWNTLATCLNRQE